MLSVVKCRLVDKVGLLIDASFQLDPVLLMKVGTGILVDFIPH